jgi:hypothetical protein
MSDKIKPRGDFNDECWALRDVWGHLEEWRCNLEPGPVRDLFTEWEALLTARFDFDPLEGVEFVEVYLDGEPDMDAPEADDA